MNSLDNCSMKAIDSELADPLLEVMQERGAEFVCSESRMQFEEKLSPISDRELSQTKCFVSSTTILLCVIIACEIVRTI
jgi:hypothetical protein